MAIRDLKEQMARLPHQPGVYLFANDAGETLYVVSNESLSRAGTPIGQEVAEQLALRRASLVAQIASTAELERTERAALAMRRTALRAELASIDQALTAERRRLGLATAAAQRFASMRAQGFVLWLGSQRNAKAQQHLEHRRM